MALRHCPACKPNCTLNTPPPNISELTYDFSTYKKNIPFLLEYLVNLMKFMELVIECDIFQVKGHSRTGSGAKAFIAATKRDALLHLESELSRLVSTAPESQKERVRTEFDGFTDLFKRFLEESGPSVDWDRIEKLPHDAVRDYASLTTPTADLLHQMLNKLVVVKLNGGLGTSMGCYGPKSVITVRNDLTFLDLTVQQIEVSDFPPN